MRMQIRESFWPWIWDPEWEKIESGIRNKIRSGMFIPDPQRFCLRSAVAGISFVAGAPWIPDDLTVAVLPGIAGVPGVTCVPAVLSVSAVAYVPAPAVILVVASYPADLVVFYVLFSAVQCDILDNLTPTIGLLFFLLSDDQNVDYRTTKVEKLSDHPISDQALNLSDYDYLARKNYWLPSCEIKKYVYFDRVPLQGACKLFHLLIKHNIISGWEAGMYVYCIYHT